MPAIGTFDIETRGLGGEFIVSAVCDKNDEITYQHDSKSLLVELLARHNRGTIFYAHNGANYDFKYLILDIVEYKLAGKIANLEFLVAGDDRFIQIKLWRTAKDKQPLIIRDSYALMPSGLKDISAKFAPEYEKKTLDLNEVEFNPENAQHMEYLQYDVLGLRYSLLRFFELTLMTFGIVPNVTIASTALKAWKQTIPIDQIYFRTHKAAEAFIRHAYLGGMVYIKEVGVVHNQMVKLDISGAYGYAMKNFDMPLGSVCHTDSYEEGKLGFYKAKVIAPEKLEKYLIGVHIKGKGIVWARGSFEAYIDSYTYEYALKLGYKIEIVEGYFFLSRKNLFGEFVSKCERIEFANKGNALGDVAKLMRNALYGKFGTYPDKKEYGVLMDITDGWEPVADDNGLPHKYLSERAITIDASYMMPHWAATITALVRLYLYDIDALLEHSTIYNDTDSTVVPREVYEKHRDELISEPIYGRVKVEEEYSSFLVRGPKTYLGRRVKPIVNKKTGLEEWYDMKAKGIPHNELTPELIENGGSIEFTMLNGIIPMISKGKRISQTMKRAISDIKNSAAWELDENEHTVRPIELGEE